MRESRSMGDGPNWRQIAHDLAWSQAGQPHTSDERKALTAYDEAVLQEQHAEIAVRTAVPPGPHLAAVMAHVRQEDTASGQARW